MGPGALRFAAHCIVLFPLLRSMRSMPSTRPSNCYRHTCSNPLGLFCTRSPAASRGLPHSQSLGGPPAAAWHQWGVLKRLFSENGATPSFLMLNGNSKKGIIIRRGYHERMEDSAPLRSAPRRIASGRAAHRGFRVEGGYCATAPCTTRARHGRIRNGERPTACKRGRPSAFRLVSGIDFTGCTSLGGGLWSGAWPRINRAPGSMCGDAKVEPQPPNQPNRNQQPTNRPNPRRNSCPRVTAVFRVLVS